MFLFALSIIIYLLKEISEKWGISTRRIQDLCKESRIPGIIMIGRTWGILEDAGKPADARIKSEKYVKGVVAVKIYVTAFLDFKTFKKFSESLAWETEVWIADMPDHMIHLNGDKFLGPR